MKLFYLIYSCDAWHRHTTKELIGFYSDKRKIKGCINRYIKANNLPKLGSDYDDINEFISKKQTQGRETNFIIDTLNNNTDTF
jgi:hypothetical protein